MFWSGAQASCLPRRKASPKLPIINRFRLLAQSGRQDACVPDCQLTFY
ncbi:MAG: hypothetical protein M3367_17320 [Acidobacteriota bacterium]|nr:hypothetical protein [Acidobacteriota bacterium]